MSTSRTNVAKVLGFVLLALAAASFDGPARAAVRIFSYDPADDLTLRTAGSLTFEFNQRLIFTTVLRVRSTQGQASAALKPADEAVLGRGGLSALIGDRAQERDLYEVEPSDEGLDLIHAFCPGSTRAWLAFGRLVENQDLRVQVLGDDPQVGPKPARAKLCETLQFSFHGEWRLPPGPGVPIRDIPVPKFPY